MKIAFLGGSFNPPHIEHTGICRYIIKKTLADKIMVSPCFSHPFGKALAPFDYRYSMCKLAMAELGSMVIVSDIERRLGKVSTTIDTIQALIRENPENSYHIVIGTDILKEKHKWKDFDYLMSIAPPIVIKRAGYNDAVLQKDCTGVSANPGLSDLSSSEIRREITEGGNIGEYVQAGVREFIELHKLYR